MNWEALGATGELIGSIAVVISVAYLAFQIKRNTHQLRRQETNTALEQANFIRSMRLEDSMSALLARIQENPEESLTPQETVKLRAYLEMEIWQTYNLWDRYNSGVLESKDAAVESIVRALFKGKHARDYWKSNSIFFPEGFREMANAIFEEGA